MAKKLFVCFAFLIMVLSYLPSNRLFVFQDANLVYNGKSSGEIVYKKTLPFLKYDGAFKSYKIDSDYQSLLKKLNAKLVFVENIGDTVSEYYYSNALPYKEVIKGNKVNLHIAKSSEQIVVGTPIIYGAF